MIRIPFVCGSLAFVSRFSMLERRGVDTPVLYRTPTFTEWYSEIQSMRGKWHGGAVETQSTMSDRFGRYRSRRRLTIPTQGSSEYEDDRFPLHIWRVRKSTVVRSMWRLSTVSTVGYGPELFGRDWVILQSERLLSCIGLVQKGTLTHFSCTSPSNISVFHQSNWGFPLLRASPLVGLIPIDKKQVWSRIWL